MSYIHPSWNYQGHQGIPMDQHMAYDPSMVPPPMMHPIDGYMYPQPPMEMIDYYHQPIMDYDEYTENLSRPRLTKEQVETLEAQFQAHPKPSSNVKRQLAAQTNLSLPRVAVCTKRSFAICLDRKLIEFAELVPEPSRKGQATETPGRIRKDDKGQGRG